MTKSTDYCPSCREPISRLRTVPARLPKLFRWRIYECHSCNKTIETAEVVTSHDLRKRYVARVEEHRARPGAVRRLRFDTDDAVLVPVPVLARGRK